MDSSEKKYYSVPRAQDLAHQSDCTLLLGYEAGTGRPTILRVGSSYENAEPSSPSKFISISPFEYNKERWDQTRHFIWPSFSKKNKATLRSAQLALVDTQKVTAAYEHQRGVLSLPWEWSVVMLTSGIIQNIARSDPVRRLETLLSPTYVEQGEMGLDGLDMLETRYQSAP